MRSHFQRDIAARTASVMKRANMRGDEEAVVECAKRRLKDVTTGLYDSEEVKPPLLGVRRFRRNGTRFLVTRPLSAAAVVVATGSRPEKPPLRGGGSKTCGGDLSVLVGGCARRADCAHDLAVDHDRQAAIHRRYAGQSLHARGRASGRHGILQGLGRSLDVVGRDRLAQRDLDAGELRVVHAEERYQPAAAVDDGNRLLSAILAGFRYGC